MSMRFQFGGPQRDSDCTTRSEPLARQSLGRQEQQLDMGSSEEYDNGDHEYKQYVLQHFKHH